MHDDIWWMNPGGHVRRSSLADERDIIEFLERTGQTTECIFSHGLVVSLDFAQSLLRKGKCVCRAAI